MATQGIWNFQQPVGYTHLKNTSMNLKRIFGTLLTVIGSAGLIFTAVTFVNTASGENNTKALVIYGILGFVFFLSGISLVRTTKDAS